MPIKTATIGGNTNINHHSSNNCPVSAITEPTDRSIPPVKITNVIPTARIPLIETCLIILEILSAVKKLSDGNRKRINIKLKNQSTLAFQDT